MNSCYICGDKLSKDNQSSEHIILAGLGGKLENNNIMCRKCNSDFGSNLDYKLTDQIGIYATLLKLRTRTNKKETVYNDKDRFSMDQNLKLKLLPSKPELKDGMLNIVASSDEELIRIVNSYKRTNPNIDVNQVVSTARREKFYPEINIKSCFGGIDAKRVYCKMAMNFYMHYGGTKEVIAHLIPFILQKSNEGEEDVQYLSTASPFYSDTNFSLSHRVFIRGDTSHKILFCYIELFDTFNMLIILNRNYYGQEILYSYHYDVSNKKEVKSPIVKGLTFDHLLSSCFPTINQSIRNQITYNLRRLHRLISVYNQEMVVSKIIDDAFNELSDSDIKHPGQALSMEEFRKINNKILSELNLLILSTKEIRDAITEDDELCARLLNEQPGTDNK